MRHDFVFVQTHIGTAGGRAAFSAGQIIGGIQRMTFGARVMLNHFGIPFFIPGFLDALLGFPQLDSVWRLGLKGLQISTRIFRALATEVDSLSSSAFRHFAAFTAEVTPLF